MKKPNATKRGTHGPAREVNQGGAARRGRTLTEPDLLWRDVDEFVPGDQARTRPEDVVVGEWPRLDGTVTRVAVCRYRDFDRADVRVWYRDKDGKLNPTEKGVSIRLADFDALERATQRARRILEERARTSTDRRGVNRADDDEEGPPW